MISIKWMSNWHTSDITALRRFISEAVISYCNISWLSHDSDCLSNLYSVFNQHDDDESKLFEYFIQLNIYLCYLQAMVLFVGAKSFKSELGACFSNLCKDANVEVRKTLSSGFHEVNFQFVSMVTIFQYLCAIPIYYFFSIYFNWIN